MEAEAMKHGQCLNEEMLTDYLEGGLEPVVKAACEVHLIACDKCRENLALFMRVLQLDTTLPEDKDLTLISSQWSHRTVRNLPKSGSSGRKGWLLSAAGLAAILVIGFISFWISGGSPGIPQTAQGVVEILLSQNRPFEARMAGQPHIPIVRTRGLESPGADYDLLAGEMAELSANSYEMGRFFLLQKDFGNAVPHLETAERDPAAPAEVHNDLGVAYMEQGGARNMDNAAEEFRHALGRDPGFAPAVFNLSIFYEKRGMLPQAEVEWERYLQLDTKSGWAEEVRSKLQGLSR